MLRWLLVLAGLAQIVLVVASVAIPRALDWHNETAKLRPLVRQIFWTYAAYIWCFNLSFGLLSLFGADILLDGSPLAMLVSGFIAVYWAARVIIQFAYFDRTDAPKGLQYSLAEAALVLLFIALTIIYSASALHNYTAAGLHASIRS